MSNLHLNLFVSRELCQLLHEKGLNADTTFQYRIYPGENNEFIFSHSFDPLKLYDDVDLKVHNVDLDFETVPAYSIADMLNLIPEWNLTKVNDIFTATSSNIFPEINPHSEKRYADACARCVLDMINARIYPIEYYNYKLNIE